MDGSKSISKYFPLSFHKLYCIQCAKVVQVTEMKGIMFHYASLIDLENAYECNGPFTQVPPPPSLTSEDWSNLFELENLIEMEILSNANPNQSERDT